MYILEVRAGKILSRSWRLFLGSTCINAEVGGLDSRPSHVYIKTFNETTPLLLYRRLEVSYLTISYV
jgi:hypothetical protein